MKRKKLLTLLASLCLVSVLVVLPFMSACAKPAPAPAPVPPPAPAPAPTPAPPAADMILYNGKVITVDKDFTIAQAVAIRDGRFVAVGNDKEVKALAGPDTKEIDLKGKAVMPGIIDSHVHPEGVGSNLVADIETYNMTSLQDLLDRIAAAAAKKKPGEWITTACNWGEREVGRFPILEELDAVTPNNPLWVPRGGHYGFANSLAMKLAGITKDTPEPIGGEIVRDPQTGELTGVLKGSAQKLVTKLLPPEDSLANLRKGIPYVNSIGVTAIANDGVGPDLLRAYHTLKNSGDLTMRVVGMLSINPTMSKEEISGMINAIAYSGLEGGGLGDDILKVVGIKTVNESTTTGEAMWPRESLRDALLEAAEKEVRFSIHSVCAMNEENLGLYQEANEQFPITHLRWVIVHQHGTTPEMIQINKELGLVVQHDMGFAFIGKGPEIWFGKMFGFPNYPDRLITPVSLWLKAGVPFGLSSDAGGGNTEPSVWSSVFVACNRENWPGWGEEFNISREEALRAVTMGSAYKLGMEEKIGSIESGKLADLAVLAADPLTCTPDELHDMTAVMTILGGKIVYEK